MADGFPYEGPSSAMHKTEYEQWLEVEPQGGFMRSHLINVFVCMRCAALVIDQGEHAWWHTQVVTHATG